MDRYLPEDVRTILEERFWHTVEEKSTVEAFSRDRTILTAPDTHPAFFSDHGVVHARDVAAGTLELADVVDGRLLPAPACRPPGVRHGSRGLDRLHPRRGDERSDARRPSRPRDLCGADAVLACNGRRAGPALGERRLGLSRIRSVGAVDPFRIPDEVVLRELASLALAHSKSMVPATLHADFPRFRSVLQQAVLVEFEEHRRAGARLNPDDGLPDALGANGR